MNPSGGVAISFRRFGRFEQPAWEERFQAERVSAGRTRSRVMLATGMLLVAMFGLVEAIYSAPVAPGFIGRMLYYRIYCVVPAWLLLFILTFLPENTRRTAKLNVIGTVLVCWGLTLMSWDRAMGNPGFKVIDGLFGGTIFVFIICALTLPMRFSGLVVAATASLIAPLGFFALTMRNFALQAPFTVSALLAVALAVTVLAWYRERAERTMFAQRETVKQLAEKLDGANQVLADLNREQAEFMAIAAHDLRAPLATVRGYAELLAGDRITDPAARQRALGHIRDESARMLGLVTDYLGAEAAHGQAQAPRLARVDLLAEARKAAERYVTTAEHKQQKLEISGDTVWTQADALLLAQIMDNLVSNALKFSPTGKRVQLAVSRAAAGARVTVIDEGPGIPADEQAGLFRKFGRTSTRPTGGETSHGLGLAVVKRLAEAMGGRVGCESEPGAGSRFWVDLREAA